MEFAHQLGFAWSQNDFQNNPKSIQLPSPEGSNVESADMLHTLFFTVHKASWLSLHDLRNYGEIET